MMGLKAGDFRVHVDDKDVGGEDSDGLFCAVLLEWSGEEWFNAMVVAREDCPIKAFNKVIEIAKEKGRGNWS